MSWARGGDNLAEACEADPAAALLFALEKFIKANKQLMAVARAINRKASSLWLRLLACLTSVVKVVAEKDAQQLEQALTNLSETTSDMAEDKKAAQNSTNKETDVKKFVSRTCTISKSSSDLCRLCGSVTTDTQVTSIWRFIPCADSSLLLQQVTLYKSLGLAATTLRDAMLLMVDTLMAVPPEWQVCPQVTRWFPVSHNEF
jgi:hypothetical protein